MSNTEIEKRIQHKLNKLCKKYGELYYKKVDHIVADSYKSLDILTKKSIINKISNTLIIVKARYGVELAIMHKNKDINLKLAEKDCEIRSHHLGLTGRAYYNDFLSEDTHWYKFYTKDNNSNSLIEVELIGGKERLDFIDYYVKDKLIIFAILKGYKLPLIKIDENLKTNLDYIKLIFDSKEIDYINNNIHIADIY